MAIAERMRQAGLDPVVVREPGGTHAAEIARRRCSIPTIPSVPSPSSSSIWPPAPTCAKPDPSRVSWRGGWCFLTVSRSPQRPTRWRAGASQPEVVVPANRAAAHGLVPDLTLILDLAPEVGQNRQVAGGKRLDRLERESGEFHRRVAEFYLAVHGDRVRHLDGRLPPDRLLQAAWTEILKAAPERFGAVTG